MLCLKNKQFSVSLPLSPGYLLVYTIIWVVLNSWFNMYSGRSSNQRANQVIEAPGLRIQILVLRWFLFPPNAMISVPRCPLFVVVHHKMSWSNNSRTIWLRMINFWTDIQTDIPYSRIGYDVTSCFWLAANWISILAMSATTANAFAHI